jgi:hypothetical protein
LVNADPLTRLYTNEVALQALLCENEEPIEQGGVVKVCIECTDSAISILGVRDFAFSTSGGGDQDTSQVAFANGSPQPLSEFVDCSGNGPTCSFHTMLVVADFYHPLSTEVTGSGNCNLQYGSSGRARRTTVDNAELVQNEAAMEVS